MCEYIDSAEDGCRDSGYISSSEKGGDQVGPYVKIHQKYGEMLKGCFEKLGLSPADRAKVILPKLNTVDKDEDDELFD